MKLPLNRIIVENRMRKDYGDLTSLKDSIRLFGLLHPILVDKNGHLICGGRRLQACKEIGLKEIEVTFFEPNLEAIKNEQGQKLLNAFIETISGTN